MPQLVQPRPEFRATTAAEVRAALADPDPSSPITQEVKRLLDGYTRNFAAMVKRLGYIPSYAFTVRPGTAIEAVAMDLVLKVIQERAGVLLQTGGEGKA